MFGYLGSLFAGNSSQHASSASKHIKDAASALANASVYATKTAANVVATGAQLGVAYGTHKVIASEIIPFNAALQLSATVSNYLAPTSFTAKSLGTAAFVSGTAAKFLVTHPVAALGLTVGGYLALHPEYVVSAGKNFGLATLEAAKIGINLTGAGLETAASGALKVKETAEEVKYYLDGHVFDRQDGFGINGNYPHKLINPETLAITKALEFNDEAANYGVFDPNEGTEEDWVAIGGESFNLTVYEEL